MECKTKVVGATFMTPDNAGSINRTPTLQKVPNRKFWVFDKGGLDMV